MEGELCPTGAGRHQQWRRQETAQCVQCNGPVRPVIMIAVGSEERGGEVEDVALLDHQRAVQGSTYRGMSMAAGVLPGAVEEGSPQLTVGRGPVHRTHLMRLFIEDVVVVNR